MPVYCVDSSSWILAGDNYPQDRTMFATFWSWLDGRVGDGIVIVPDEVFVELSGKGQNLVVEWTKKRRERIFRPHDEELQAKFREITNRFPDLTRKGKPEAKSDGDAWVIALAIIRGAVCVAEDRKKKRGVSFPIVCDACGLECIFLRDFIERES